MFDVRRLGHFYRPKKYRTIRYEGSKRTHERSFCPKDSGCNRATDLCNNSILQSQMGGALKIVRGSRLSIIFDILTFFGPK